MDTISTPQRPFVSVLMPIGNDIGAIVRALGSTLDQDYPRDRIEVIAVDYGALDGTRNVAMRATYDNRMRLIDLPGSKRAAALEFAFGAARGEIVVVLDGQTAIPPGYVTACVDALERDNSDVALGSVVFTGTSAWAEANARATSVMVGRQPVAFRRAVVHDAAFLATTTRASHVQLPAGLVATRPGPATFGELCVSHFQRGQTAAELLRRNSRMVAPSQLLAGSVAGLSGVSLIALLIRPLRPIVAGLWRWYLVLLAWLTLSAANRPPFPHIAKGRGNAPPPQPDELLLYLPLAFFAIHLSYGWGLVSNLLRKNTETAHS